MRSLLIALLAVASIGLPAPALADAIMPFDGECPPGLERAIRNHAEVCSPAVCRSGDDCPSGSSCEILFECWAPRPATGGRRADEDPRMVDRPIGACAEGHHCSEGVCRERRQCEPTEATTAWSRTDRRWSGEAYVAASGCSAGAARSGSTLPIQMPIGMPILMLLASALVLRRSR